MPDRKLGYLSSALMGVFFSAGWAPCVGPVLGAILTLALNGGSVSTGVSLLSAYSAGLAIPFLIAALGVGWVSLTLRKYGKVMHYVEVVMGVVLIIIGSYFSQVFERIARRSIFWIDLDCRRM
jgi:cytochrome c-type biogenesis protein